MAQAEKSKKLTVFKSDRHEDMASIYVTAVVVAVVMLYMAFIVPDIKLTPPFDGKIVSVGVAADAVVKKGDPLYTIEYKEKKYAEGQLTEKVVQKEVTSKFNGRMLDLKAKAGDEVKKGKTVLMTLEHEKGTLP